MNRRSAPWERAFTSIAPARSKIQASAYRQLPSHKSSFKTSLVREGYQGDFNLFGWKQSFRTTGFSKYFLFIAEKRLMLWKTHDAFSFLKTQLTNHVLKKEKELHSESTSQDCKISCCRFLSTLTVDNRPTVPLRGAWKFMTPWFSSFKLQPAYTRHQSPHGHKCGRPQTKTNDRLWYRTADSGVADRGDRSADRHPWQVKCKNSGPHSACILVFSILLLVSRLFFCVIRRAVRWFWVLVNYRFSTFFCSVDQWAPPSAKFFPSGSNF